MVRSLGHLLMIATWNCYFAQHQGYLSVTIILAFFLPVTNVSSVKETMASSQDPVIGTEHVWIQNFCLYKKTRYVHLNVLMLTSHRCMVSYVMFPFNSQTQNVYTIPGPCFRKHRFHWQKTWKPNCKRGFTSDKHQGYFLLEPQQFQYDPCFQHLAILSTEVTNFERFLFSSIQF